MGFVCKVCKKHFDDDHLYSDDICSEKCFHIDFWNEALDDKAVIINGVCYHIGPENSHSAFRGFGGSKFTIEFKDGKRITTTNLWHQGKIPEEFMKEDNAKFVKE